MPLNPGADKPRQRISPEAFDELRSRSARTVEAAGTFHAALQREHRGYALLAEIVAAVHAHRPSLLAKQAAYSLLYAIPSALIVLVSLAAIVDRNTGAGVSRMLRQFIAEQAPTELQPLLGGLVRHALTETSASTAIVAAIVSLGIAVWGGAGGVGALIYAINKAYDVADTRSFVKNTLLRLGLMLLSGVMVIGSFILLAFGRNIGEWLVDIVGQGSVLVDFLLSGPVWSLLLLFGALLMLYWFGPDVPKTVRWILPGAIGGTLAIALTFELLGLILAIANPGTAYGAAGSVLILLWSLFVVSEIVIVGAVVNAVLARHYDTTMNASPRLQAQQR